MDPQMAKFEQGVNKDKEQQLTINHLPFDVLVSVFSFLNLTTLCEIERGIVKIQITFCIIK